MSTTQRILDIAQVLGIAPGAKDISKLRYNKLCILADADSDGLHIATLLCALFLRHFPETVRKGHVYVAMPPLFRIDMGKEVFYALDEEEKEGIIKRLTRRKKKGKINIQRFKGLGEMNPSQLKETTIAPDSRRLVQLTIDPPKETGGAPPPADAADAADPAAAADTETRNGRDVWEIMDMLLGKKRAKDRKHWIETQGVSKP